MQRLKAAVIGAGQMGSNHARVYTQMPNINLVAITDQNHKTALKASKQYNTKPYTNSLEMLRQEQPDLVSVAVPTHLHYHVATEVLAHKCHLLLEKPIADREDQARKIIDLAQKNHVQLMIGHVERFNPAVQALRVQLKNKKLGNIYYLEARRSGPGPNKPMRCGVTLDIAVHDLDIFPYITGCRIEQVNAATSKILNKQHEDWMHSMLFLNQGIMATLHCDWLTPIKRRKLAVVGSIGTFVVNYISQSLIFYKDKIGRDGTIKRHSIQHAIKRREPLLIEIETFINSIQKHDPSPVSGEDGLIALKAANSILHSAQQNKKVTVPRLT
jgi:predicted dehydrogenase